MNKITNYFKHYYAFLILLIAGIVLLVMFIHVKKSLEKIYTSFINNTIEKTTFELKNFFEPISRDVLIAKEMGENGLYQNQTTQQLNKLFIPYLSHSEQLSSMHIANSKGDEYMLLQQFDFWQNRVTKLGSKNEKPVIYKWHYMHDKDDSLISKSNYELDYNPVEKSWYKNAINNKSEKFPVWTKPYQFLTTKEVGITASMKWKDASDTSITNVVSFDVLLEDISNFTRNLAVSEHGKTFVITVNGEVLGLPYDERFLTKEACDKFALSDVKKLNIKEIDNFFDAWKNTTDKHTILKFKSEGSNWRGSLQPFLLTPNYTLYIGVIVPENIIQSNFDEIQLIIIACFVIIVLFTFLVYLSFRRNNRNLFLLEIEKKKSLNKNLQLNKALNEKEILLKETYHRVKNNLQIISSLLNLQSNFVNDNQAREAFQKSRRRIESMALVHQKLYNANDLNQIDLGDYIEQLVQSISHSFEGNNVKFSYKINSTKVLVNLDIVINLGLIINELVSNSLKYAFENAEQNSDSRISIELNKISENNFELIVSDNGIGLPKDFNIEIPKGLGFEIITALIDQINGKYTIDSNNGLSFKLNFSI